jgi:hypothetical protein
VVRRECASKETPIGTSDVGAAALLPYTDARRTLVRTRCYNATPSGLRVPTTFVGHFGLLTVAFNRSSNGVTFGSSIATRSIGGNVSYSVGSKEGTVGWLTRIYRLEEMLALKKGYNERLGLSRRKTSREGIVLRTNYIARIGGAM